MTLNHIHCSVCDLKAAIRWLREVWLAEPTFANDRMAAVPFGAFTVILDQSDKDTCATIGFESAHCDADYDAVVKRGAVPLEPPANRAWGARSAYLRGPGAITFEIEQALT
jgi:uncharacterized glyoxalase superfamily protein PhnB